MNANTDPIANALGLTPMIPSNQEIAPAIVETEEQEFAKKNIRSAIEDGQQAMGDLLGIAHQSQHPRAYEVVAKLIDSITNASEKLARIEAQQQETAQRAQSAVKGPGTVNNNLFVGNAAELLHLLKSVNKPKE